MVWHRSRNLLPTVLRIHTSELTLCRNSRLRAYFLSLLVPLFRFSVVFDLCVRRVDGSRAGGGGSERGENGRWASTNIKVELLGGRMAKQRLKFNLQGDKVERMC